ncbi:Lrp/AsnC family transcriptional regulator [Thioclava sp. FTW29]|uniref:Lrp/AsnC family transcriptional regulator n=1 Tax=Thioclava litoralis TaxID=3076557 RepID=A0ABZ1E5H6_9RHOB|nr:Lrp/AsnC family transcriptional regulator [Thioclava sp. FTW29]
MRLSPTENLILELLRENSRRSLTEIADIVGLSRPTVKYHVDKLIESKVISRFTIEVDTTQVDSVTGTRAMFDLQLKRNTCSIVYASIQRWSEVVSAWSLTGDTDMRILLEAANLSILEELRDRLSRHPEVLTVTTSVILKSWREKT